MLKKKTKQKKNKVAQDDSLFFFFCFVLQTVYLLSVEWVQIICSVCAHGEIKILH